MPTQQPTTAFQATSTLTAPPTPTNADAWTTPFYLGTFAPGTWHFNFKVRGSANGQQGHFQLRVWASPHQSGGSVRELTAGLVAGNVTPPITSPTTDYDASINWAAPAIALNNECLLFQLEWVTDAATAGVGATINFNLSSSGISTALFTYAPSLVWQCALQGWQPNSPKGYSKRQMVGPNSALANASLGISDGTVSGNTIATPTELLFNGQHGFVLSADSTITSDWLPLNFQKSDTLVSMPLSRAPEAYARMMRGEARFRMVLTMAERD